MPPTESYIDTITDEVETLSPLELGIISEISGGSMTASDLYDDDTVTDLSGDSTDLDDDLTESGEPLSGYFTNGPGAVVPVADLEKALDEIRKPSVDPEIQAFNDAMNALPPTEPWDAPQRIVEPETEAIPDAGTTGTNGIVFQDVSPLNTPIDEPAMPLPPAKPAPLTAEQKKAQKTAEKANTDLAKTSALMPASTLIQVYDELGKISLNSFQKRAQEMTDAELLEADKAARRGEQIAWRLLIAMRHEVVRRIQVKTKEFLRTERENAQTKKTGETSTAPIVPMIVTVAEQEYETRQIRDQIRAVAVDDFGVSEKTLYYDAQIEQVFFHDVHTNERGETITQEEIEQWVEIIGNKSVLQECLRARADKDTPPAYQWLNPQAMLGIVAEKKIDNAGYSTRDVRADVQKMRLGLGLNAPLIPARPHAIAASTEIPSEKDESGAEGTTGDTNIIKGKKDAPAREIKQGFFVATDDISPDAGYLIQALYQAGEKVKRENGLLRQESGAEAYVYRDMSGMWSVFDVTPTPGDVMAPVCFALTAQGVALEFDDTQIATLSLDSNDAEPETGA